MHLLVAVLFVIEKWKQFKCSSINEKINKLQYTYIWNTTQQYKGMNY